ncbi:hypothetical protein TNCV_2837291 [Trichonephila clavipes]|nr:hypothetical protein TNCV_2837291 [Trichonephila clavipes]
MIPNVVGYHKRFARTPLYLAFMLVDKYTKTFTKGEEIRDVVLSSFNVFEPTLGVVDNDVWSTEDHDWNVWCSAPYRIVSVKLRVLKDLYMSLHCIGVSAEPLSGAYFHY